MGLAPTRKMTDEDERRVQRAAHRFARNHQVALHVDGEDLADEDQVEMLEARIECSIVREVDQIRLRRLWRRCILRALKGDGDSWGWGYVGWSAQ